MSVLENIKGPFKNFGPTTWSIKNKASIYLVMLVVSLFGVFQFVTLPKEQFPDIVIPTIYVQTIYVGNSPKDIENLVSRPIEKQIKGITGAKINKTTSTSVADYSAIMVEFSTDVKTDVALQKVKDAVDKAKPDLPTDLTEEPAVMEVSFSEQPIMYVNLYGDYDLPRMKKYADDMQDKLEELSQLNRVDLVGAPEREFQINVDNYKMRSANITFDDIAGAVSRENMDISGGLLDVGSTKRTLQLKGQFKTAYDIQKVVVRNTGGSPIYLKDIAEIKDTIKDRESYARLNGKNVITLNIIKRAGENLIETSDAVKKVVEEMQKTTLPKDLNIAITGDQSKASRTSFNDLVNTIVIGFVLVLIILMFFMGVTNAFFVALSVPLSMFVAFIFLPAADLIVGTHVTLNFIVLFALLFGLGIIVDDAIVVIENTHRIFVEGKGRLNSERSAMMAAGEVFVPVLAGTLTTLAPFVPLLFWPGIIGKFMIYLPTMLIFTLTASLIVAFIMNPVFAVDFMNHPEGEHKQSKSAIFRKPALWVALVVGILFDLGGITFLGNFLIFIVLMIVLNKYVLDGVIHAFQNRALPWIMGHYETALRWALKGWRPVHLLLSTFVLLILTFIFFGTRKVPVVFFPSGDPNQIYVYLKLPVGTDVNYTDSVTQTLEKKVYQVLHMDKDSKGNYKENPIVESVISNVAVGAGDPQSGDRSTRPELGRIQISFVEFEKRHGVATAPILDEVRQAIKGIPGAEISVDQEKGGPPTDPPINIEVASEDFDNLIKTAVSLKNYLDSIQIPGVEELKMDIDLTNPEVTFTVDRERALIEGVSSQQIGMEIRTAVFGREVSKIKDGEDEYKIQLRNLEGQRKSLADLLNMNITFRDMGSGGAIKHVPISSLVKVDYTSTLGSVKRKNQKRVITIRSNVLMNVTTPTAVNQVIAGHISKFNQGAPEGVTIKQTGEGEQQAETGAFLGKALVIALFFILLILVIQFNSISKPVIILTEIIFSVIGVLLGFAFTGMQVSVVMTGIGIVGLAGIVVKNGILVIEFADELRARGMKTREALVQAGKTRIIPVLLTALAAILGLIPLAVGLNINFVTLFSELNPHIFFGGDNVVFWKPLSWTIIFGLAFAFFMTLLILPAMYLIAERLRRPMRKMYGGKWISFAGIPPLTFVFIFLMIGTMIRQYIKVYRRRRKLAGKPEKVNEAFIGSWF
ncbi:copper transporter [Niastella yeongjuensis]|uniref:Copper transporter n=1 Tax=Niastella yeongjuensis TaxID=354355 RepID=A0A1V9EM76_9BACT|nr:efflux RND transporter permease subunit [Niastella yeongjuensis]OQP46975.1 copper transporter [Niastella yeongjuensis]SEN63422.1 Multidrug efflux pump subunit AcrB [Niastella yeongjuensis]